MARRDERIKMARPGEPEAVRTTIVGGRPPAGGANVGDVPRGVEVLIKKAAVDPAFKKMLLENRAGAAEAIALELEPAEAAMLNAVPEEQLRAIIGRTKVSPRLRPAFLGYAAGVMLAALASTAYAVENEGSDQIIISTGIRTVVPEETEETALLPEGTGIIEGVVYDGNRDPIGGVNIKIVGTKYEAVTNSDGGFRLFAIPIGKYEIKASRIGYEPAKRTNIEVTDGGTTTAYFQLEAGLCGGIRP